MPGKKTNHLPLYPNMAIPMSTRQKKHWRKKLRESEAQKMHVTGSDIFMFTFKC